MRDLERLRETEPECETMIQYLFPILTQSVQLESHMLANDKRLVKMPPNEVRLVTRFGATWLTRYAQGIIQPD